MKKLVVIIIVFFFLYDFSFAQKQFKSVGNLVSYLDSLAAIQNGEMRNHLVNDLWSELTRSKKIPYSVDDSVVFLYKGKAQSVSWAGDFNQWAPNTIEYQGQKIGLSDIWFSIHQFPSNARLDYKIVVDGNWITDPSNPNYQLSGVGSVNSELRMPDWIYPEITNYSSNIEHGFFSDYDSIKSSYLNILVHYKIYLPFNYKNLENLPTIYVTDGHEYTDENLGSMINVLDNLIADGKIKPVIAVFIDPRVNLLTSKNQRMIQYTINKNFADFVCKELTPFIDSNYKTNKSADARAILGTSLGGINSTYFGINQSDSFRLIGINSPAYWFKPDIYDLVQNSIKLPLKFFLTTGTINDTQKDALKMKTLLENKGYHVQYIEVPEGHSWGNWRSLLDDMLIYFFSAD